MSFLMSFSLASRRVLVGDFSGEAGTSDSGVGSGATGRPDEGLAWPPTGWARRVSSAPEAAKSVRNLRLVLNIPHLARCCGPEWNPVRTRILARPMLYFDSRKNDDQSPHSLARIHVKHRT